jgi:hypothetical protein
MHRRAALLLRATMSSANQRQDHAKAAVPARYWVA